MPAEKTILLCDDEPAILKAAEFKLRGAGFRVITAGDGEAAWEAACRESPDLIISDCQMPRLDGIGLLRKLRADARFAGLPVIMLTAKGFELDGQRLREDLGVMHVMAKPFSPREILARAKALLEVEIPA
ncbi:MAG: response regulator [Thermogutta sp.]|nr:response regulator [Thermogutta sp.]